MKRALAVLLVSFGLGILGLWLVYRGALLQPASYRLSNPRLVYVAVAGLAFLVLLLAPTVKLLLLCRFQGLPMRFRKALLVHLAGIFGAVITPSSTGGAPAMVMALSRLGFPVGKGVGVASQTFLLDLIFFAWAGPLGLAYLIKTREIQLPVNAEILTVVAMGAAVSLAVVIGRYPRLISGTLLFLAKHRFLKRFSGNILAVVRDYHRSALAYLTFSSGEYAALHLFTGLSWLSNFVMLWGLLALYGVDRDLVMVMALLAEISLLANFVPTPGGSGFIEAAVGLTAGGSSANAPLILWRLLTYYLFFLLGPVAGWLLFHSRPLKSRKVRGANRKGGGKVRP